MFHSVPMTIWNWLTGYMPCGGFERGKVPLCTKETPHV